MNIIDDLNTSDSWINFISKPGRTAFVEKFNVRVDLCGTGNDLDLTISFLENAFKRGCECLSYHFSYSSLGQNNIFYLLEKFNFCLEKLIGFLINSDFSDEKLSYSDFTIYQRSNPSIKTFSPFHFDRVKPLKSLPKKWTMAHVKRLIINHQFSDFRCDGRYTDDYAYDASINYGKKTIDDHLSFVKNLIESPSGWWVSYSHDRLNISCHHFDSNSLIPVLEN